MQYVIGVDGGSTKCLMKAKSINGELLASSTGKTTNHLLVGVTEAGRRVVEQFDRLISSFGGKREECACVVVGAAGIDSPNDKTIAGRFYNSLLLSCPIFCMNDGNVALYSSTKGVGIQAISGTGSVIVGRNQKGEVARAGGYPSIIFGNEGSSQWIAHNALNYASKYLDGGLESSPLIEKLDAYFNGLTVNKLIDCAIALRHRPVDSQLAVLVCEAAEAGDPGAIGIQRKGACELIDVADICIRKLGFARDDAFISGVWGSVFVKNRLFYQEYKDEFERRYPNSTVILPDGDAADGATQLAFDYLDGKADFIESLL